MTYDLYGFHPLAASHMLKQVSIAEKVRQWLAPVAAKKILILPNLIFNFFLMETEEKDGRTKRYLMMRSIRDFGMGLIYILVACVLLFSDKFGKKVELLPKPLSYIFGGIAIIYGLFRIYRGIQKNYLR